MKTTFMNVSRGVIGALAFSLGISSCQSSQSKMIFEQEGDSLTVIHKSYAVFTFARRGEDSRSTGLHCFGLGSGRHGRTPVKGESGLFCSLCFA
jgi:hypothetical protein